MNHNFYRLLYQRLLAIIIHIIHSSPPPFVVGSYCLRRSPITLKQQFPCRRGDDSAVGRRGSSDGGAHPPPGRTESQGKGIEGRRKTQPRWRVWSMVLLHLVGILLNSLVYDHPFKLLIEPQVGVLQVGSFHIPMAICTQPCAQQLRGSQKCTESSY